MEIDHILIGIVDICIQMREDIEDVLNNKKTNVHALVGIVWILTGFAKT